MSSQAGDNDLTARGALLLKPHLSDCSSASHISSTHVSLFLNHSSNNNNNNSLNDASFGRPAATLLNECRLIVINLDLTRSLYALLNVHLDKTTQLLL